MTLDELELIHDLISSYKNSESGGDNMVEEDADKALKIVERELALKRMDPRKSGGINYSGTHYED